MKLMHLPRTHRIDAAAVSGQFSRGIVELQYERAQKEAADIGAKRFTDPLALVKNLYLVSQPCNCQILGRQAVPGLFRVGVF
eukprot:8524604-Pyramimonas_sp.AAC.1